MKKIDVKKHQEAFQEINSFIKTGCEFGEFGNENEAVRLFKKGLNLALKIDDKQKINEISSLILMYL